VKGGVLIIVVAASWWKMAGSAEPTSYAFSSGPVPAFRLIRLC